MKRNPVEDEWTFAEIIEDRLPKISLTALSAMSRVATPWKVKKRELIVKQGELCNRWIFISRGLARMTFTKAGKTNTLFFDGGGGIFTSFSSLINKEGSVFAVEALSDCWGWEITHEDYHKLTSEFPEIFEFEVWFLRNQYYALEGSYQRRAMTTPEERLENFQTVWTKNFEVSHWTSDRITQYIPQKILASYLSITPTMLSILRRREIDRQRAKKDKP